MLLGDRLLSEWRPLPGITVTTELIPCAEGHIRRHTVESSIACTAYDCGFAVPSFAPGFGQSAGDGAAEAHNDLCRCAVQGCGEGVVIRAWPNTSLYSTNTVIPAVKYPIPVGKTSFETAVTAACGQPQADTKRG